MVARRGVCAAAAGMRALKSNAGSAPTGYNCDLLYRKTDLTPCKTDLTSCKSDLRPYKCDLTGCNSDLTSCKTDLTSCKSSLTACNSDLTAHKSDLTACKSDLTGCNGVSPACKAILHACKASLHRGKCIRPARQVSWAEYGRGCHVPQGTARRRKCGGARSRSNVAARFAVRGRRGRGKLRCRGWCAAARRTCSCSRPPSRPRRLLCARPARDTSRRRGARRL